MRKVERVVPRDSSGDEGVRNAVSRSAAGVCRSCRSEAEQYYADSRCHYAWPIAFAVHYRSTRRENWCEPRRQRQTLLNCYRSVRLPSNSAAARSSRSRSTFRLMGEGDSRHRQRKDMNRPPRRHPRTRGVPGDGARSHGTAGVDVSLDGGTCCPRPLFDDSREMI